MNVLHGKQTHLCKWPMHQFEFWDENLYKACNKLFILIITVIDVKGSVIIFTGCILSPACDNIMLKRDITNTVTLREYNAADIHVMGYNSCTIMAIRFWCLLYFKIISSRNSHFKLKIDCLYFFYLSWLCWPSRPYCTYTSNFRWAEVIKVNKPWSINITGKWTFRCMFLSCLPYLDGHSYKRVSKFYSKSNDHEGHE